MSKPFYRFFIELSSRKWISNITGKVAKSKYSRKWITRFAKAYSIAIDDAEKPVEDYTSLNDFFTRRLKPHLRPISSLEKAVISPVDALITSIGIVKEGQLLNVKGQDYTIEELLNRSPRMINYMNGYYYVLYLSPSDYHRIHSPIEGTIVEKEYIPGRVYPVNSKGLRYMRRVLSRNERLITYLEHAAGELAVVKVGALNVSSIQYVPSLPSKLERGQDLAYFEFGSTVVLLMSNDTYEPLAEIRLGDQVKMGQALGQLKGK